ncbi:MAG: hypothetical protein IJM84_06705, partial [Bacteroidaceae bacterium]|nr:hypothetical protein [Bacteroidaceae bacterium]
KGELNARERVALNWACKASGAELTNAGEVLYAHSVHKNSRTKIRIIFKYYLCPLKTFLKTRYYLLMLSAKLG